MSDGAWHTRTCSVCEPCSDATRLDTIESGSAVFRHQVGVLGNILSPANLDKQSREIAEVKKELTHLREASDRMYKMHNGKHGPIT